MSVRWIIVACWPGVIQISTFGVSFHVCEVVADTYAQYHLRLPPRQKHFETNGKPARARPPIARPASTNSVHIGNEVFPSLYIITYERVLAHMFSWQIMKSLRHF